jgi:hypothetical protein
MDDAEVPQVEVALHRPALEFRHPCQRGLELEIGQDDRVGDAGPVAQYVGAGQ